MDQLDNQIEPSIKALDVSGTTRKSHRTRGKQPTPKRSEPTASTKPATRRTAKRYREPSESSQPSKNGSERKAKPETHHLPVVNAYCVGTRSQNEDRPNQPFGNSRFPPMLSFSRHKQHLTDSYKSPANRVHLWTVTLLRFVDGRNHGQRPAATN
jgi:hypothetical protein